MLINLNLFIAALLLLLPQARRVDAGEESLPGVENRVGKCLYCQVAVVHAMISAGVGIKSYRCLTDEMQEGDSESEMSYTLSLPAKFANTNKVKLDSGVSSICIIGGSAIRTPFGKPDVIVIPPAASIYFVAKRTNTRERRLTVTGTRSLLVVRVTAPSSTQSLSALELANTTFGTAGLKYSLAAQYRSCSAAKLNFTAASGYPSIITNGVMDLILPSTVSDVNVRDLENTILTMVKDTLAVTSLSNTFSNIMFCMPSGTTFDVGGTKGWIAYAYFPGQYSFYNNVWCGKLSAAMHEIGHNLGLRHSNENGITYKDQSCMMGSSYNSGPGTPAMCFNGHKNYLLGWYDDKKIVVNPSVNGAWSGKLVGFVDYTKAQITRSEYVLIVVGQLYIQFNLAAGFNIQTQEKANMVTIVTAPNTTSDSEMMGGLQVNQSITVGLYTIDACKMVAATSKIPKHVVVSVRLSSQRSACPPTLTTPAPVTRAPTARPTLTPTTSPSRRPTAQPTSSPTTQLTLSPTNESTILPTVLSTNQPSLQSTAAPENQPAFQPMPELP